MYTDTITLFHADGDTWYPTIVTGADFNGDSASLLGRYGESCADSVKLHIKLHSGTVSGKVYVQPKAWAQLTATEKATHIAIGERDFFCVGRVETAATIDDNSYIGGFYQHMNKERDRVFCVQNVADFSVIPHIEILAR